ncbi:hypothetical protein [Paraburkholderia phytofirmans]|uniref:Transcriptional regulator n=1 Tax=Paraburkholderia phytofirmans OLGA172 TaxID=1417228 RepID=A0A160FGT3_9BURK|nr:hypothetical protein [Paraburkholderia phytofirmans]ANB71205.1 transcriptional regulator [Paraburkholderia phytofirmans OLGA172]
MIRFADYFARILQLKDALRDGSSLPALDPLEVRIIEFVACTTHTNERLSVRNVMAQREPGSPATLYARITSVCEKGWIQLSDTEDGRRKQIKLAPVALHHFDMLFDCLIKAMSSK